MTRDELIDFENDIAAEFNAGKIRAPIHLDGGNEEQLLEIFKAIRPQDWVLGSWRMHYKCLLKDVPPKRLKADIMAGRSITLCYPEHRVISSAIVGGVLPWAVGLAASIKARNGDERVHCFLGDMTATTGMFHECLCYADGHSLLGYVPVHKKADPSNWFGGPLRFIIEDNGLSVDTPTDKTWGNSFLVEDGQGYAQSFEYKRKWPHSGAGKRVEF